LDEILEKAKDFRFTLTGKEVCTMVREVFQVAVLSFAARELVESKRQLFSTFGPRNQ